MRVQSHHFERARCPICGAYWDGACDPEDHERHEDQEDSVRIREWAAFLGMSEREFLGYQDNHTARDERDEWLDWATAIQGERHD